MLDDAVSGKGVMSEEDYLEDLAMYYGTFAGINRRTGTRWVRIPQWAMDIMDQNFDTSRFTSPTVTPANIDVDTNNALRNLRELEDLLRNLPRETKGRFKGSILTSKRKFARELRKDIDEIRRKYNLGEYKFNQKELDL